MAEPKTRPTDGDVDAFLAAVPDARRREDSRTVCGLMAEASGHPPVMWGDSIVGFGSHPQRYADGRELDWPEVAFSPRKRSLTVYLTDGFRDRTELLARLGPHTTTTACLYLGRLDRVDLAALEELIRWSVAAVRATSPD